MLMEYVQLGGPVVYPLLLCSVVALTVITERLLFWMRLRRGRESERVSRFLEATQHGQFAEAYEIGRASEDPSLRVLMRGLADRELATSLSMEMQAKTEVNQMSHYLAVLETAITWAPLLGILGTIIGIIRAFGLLSASGLPDPRLVASGIAEALVTTAAGLTIAITAIPFYRYFIRRMEQTSQTIEQHATTFELLLKQRQRIEHTEAEPVLQ